MNREWLARQSWHCALVSSERTTALGNAFVSMNPKCKQTNKQTLIKHRMSHTLLNAQCAEQTTLLRDYIDQRSISEFNAKSKCTRTHTINSQTLLIRWRNGFSFHMERVCQVEWQMLRWLFGDGFRRQYSLWNTRAQRFHHLAKIPHICLFVCSFIMRDIAQHNLSTMLSTVAEPSRTKHNNNYNLFTFQRLVLVSQCLCRWLVCSRPV